MPRISVIIPAFNAGRLLGDTLASVLHGSFQDMTIIVVDDGSSDDTAAVASAFGPRVQLIRQANQGMSASRNRGITATDSEFVALLDADDIWHPKKLELQIQQLEKQAALGACYSEFFSWDGSHVPLFAPSPTVALDEKLSGWIYPRMILTNFVLPSSVVFRRSAMAALGPFLCENQQTDDWEYLVRASRQFPFAKLAAPLVAYRQSPGSLSKRPSALNVTELMRESLIARFGLSSPQGQMVEIDELERRRYKGWRDFSDMHVVRGDLALGMAGFGRLFLERPQRLTTAAVATKALLRRLLGKSS